AHGRWWASRAWSSSARSASGCSSPSPGPSAGRTGSSSSTRPSPSWRRCWRRPRWATSSRCSRTLPRPWQLPRPEARVAGTAPEGCRRFELRLAATRQGFAAAFDELRSALDALSLIGRPRFSVELVFEEVVANVVRHGTKPEGSTTLSLEVLLEDDSVRLTFLDDGVPFDPRQRPDPAPAKDLEHAEIGGRGLMLIRSVCKGLEYARTPEGQNRLTVTVPRDATAGARMSDGARSGA